MPATAPLTLASSAVLMLCASAGAVATHSQLASAGGRARAQSAEEAQHGDTNTTPLEAGVAGAAPTRSRDGRGPLGADCPCSDAKLCRPLSPTPKPLDEVVAFPADEIYGAGRNGSYVATYDWSKITTIAPFEPLGPGPAFQQLFCEAHAHGVKVLDWTAQSYNGTGCGVAAFYSGCRTNASWVYNATAVGLWAERAVSCVVASGFDGILLDAEGSYTVGHPKLRAAVTAGVCTLKTALEAALPGAVLYWTADTGNYFDYGELTSRGCVDLWLDMDYCQCTPASRANAPLSRVSAIAKAYGAFGVPPDRLGVVFPWFGCDFVCDPANGTDCAEVVVHPAPEQLVPGLTHAGSPGDGCGVGVDAGPGVGEVQLLAPNATEPAQTSPSPDLTKHFRWRNATGGLHEVWYDDASTTRVKMAAAKSIGLRAVGMWTSDATLGDEALAKAMWAAVPTPRR